MFYTSYKVSKSMEFVSGGVQRGFFLWALILPLTIYRGVCRIASLVTNLFYLNALVLLFCMVYCLSHYSGNTTSFTIILVNMYSYLVILHLICQVQLFGYSTILTISLVNVYSYLFILHVICRIVF